MRRDARRCIINNMKSLASRSSWGLSARLLVLTIAFYCAVVRVLATMKIDNEPHYKEVLQQYPIPGVS